MQMQIVRIYANIRTILPRKPVLILLEIVAVFLLTILADRLLGFYFTKTVHYKAYAPNITAHYVSSEYKFDAVISNQGLRNEEVLLKKAKNVSERIAADFEAGKINPALVIWGQVKPDFWLLILNKNALAASLSATDVLFSKLKDCTGDIPVTVVFLPSDELIAKDYHQFRQEIGFKVDDRLLSLDFNKYLEPVVKKHRFDYISLLSDFRKDGCLDCYYPYDSHMTEVGYKRVAEKVFESIKVAD